MDAAPYQHRRCPSAEPPRGTVGKGRMQTRSAIAGGGPSFAMTTLLVVVAGRAGDQLLETPKRVDSSGFPAGSCPP